MHDGSVERPWRSLASAGRAYLFRGFGECDDRADGYWTYAYEQASNVHAALHDPDAKGHIKHLRVPFCLAYAKVPKPYSAGKLTAQAEKCMHLGYSRSKPGYILEVLEGPRKGKIITTTMVKFLENVFPMHCDYVDPTPSSGGTFVWEDIDQPEDDEPPFAEPEVIEVYDDDDDDVMPGLGGPPSEDDDDDEPPPLVPPDHRPRTRGNTDLGDWRAIYRGLDQAIAQGTAVLTTQSKSVPKRFKDIAKIEDPLERDKWYTAHYKENDTLLEKPMEDPVLTVIELPDGVSETDLYYLNTIYDKKNDGRYKARTVLSAGKEKLDGLDIGYERTF